MDSRFNPEISHRQWKSKRGFGDEGRSGPLPGGQLRLPVGIVPHHCISGLCVCLFCAVPRSVPGFEFLAVPFSLFYYFQESWTRAPRRRLWLIRRSRRRFLRRPARSACTSTASSPPITTGMVYHLLEFLPKLFIGLFPFFNRTSVLARLDLWAYIYSLKKQYLIIFGRSKLGHQIASFLTLFISCLLSALVDLHFFEDLLIG